MDSTLLEILKAIAGAVFAVVAVISAIIIAAFIIQGVRMLVKPREPRRYCESCGTFLLNDTETLCVACLEDVATVWAEHDPDCHCLSCQIDRRMEKEDRARDERIDRELEEAADRDNYEPPEPDMNADGPAEREHRMDEARRMK